MNPRYVRAILTTICTLGLSATLASAASFDTPSVEVLRSGRTSLTVRITSGMSGAPNGFSLEWLPAATYDALGAWPANGDPRILKGDFRGVPTLNTEEGSGDFRLLSMEDAGVQIGDLFDETGVVTQQRGELVEGTEYVVRVHANGDGLNEASASSPTQRATTLLRSQQDCTYTQGYWKNHPGAWPVGNLTLGTVNYSAAQLMQIFNEPAAGNGLISLAHQLIAAKLNVANGATPPAAIVTAISQADALIGGLVAPPIGAGYLAPGSTSGLTNTLDNFNQGITGPGHCGSTPTRTPTWGGLKTLYR
ncbi:MAG: hypothetical protein ABIU54_10110 [Candidatus Eisenbacteria bacterium]